MNKDIAASDLILNADTLIRIIDKLPHAVYLKDSEHKFLLANKAYLALLCTDGNHLIGKSDKDFYNQAYASSIEKIEAAVIKNGEKAVNEEERFIDCAGRTHVMKTIRLPFYIPEMEQVGILGIAVNMAKEKELEASIRMQNTTLLQQRNELDEKRKIAEELYNKVKSGMRISKFIQEAILPSEATIKRYFPESFVLYKPKEFSSGDFYWVQQKETITYLATIDCTEFDAGGTFIAMLCYDLLSQIVKEKYKPSPADILYELNEGLKNNLEQTIDITQMKEKVFVNICAVEKEKYYVEYCGSGSMVLLLNKYSNQLLELHNDAIGLPFEEATHTYTDYRIRTKKGDLLYMFTDGYAQQHTLLRGESEKFGSTRVKELMREIGDFTMDKQQDLLSSLFDEFRGDQPQTDDVIVLGVTL